MKLKQVMNENNKFDKQLHLRRKERIKNNTKTIEINRKKKIRRDRTINSGREVGEMTIEFAHIDVEGKVHIPVIIKTEGLDSIFGNGIKQFKSLSEFEDSLRRNFAKNYGFEKSVPSKINKFVMDDNVYLQMIRSIREYALNATNKNKSLSYDSKIKSLPGEQHTSWDMHIIFRRGHKTNLIKPQIEYGAKTYGRIIGADEIEQEDDSLKDLFQ